MASEPSGLIAMEATDLPEFLKHGFGAVELERIQMGEGFHVGSGRGGERGSGVD
jgi:hypothetical protein